MLPQQLSRLLSGQAHSILMRRQHHVPSVLPSLLQSCIFHLTRISGHSATFTRGLSASASSCILRKSSKASDKCHAYSQYCGKSAAFIRGFSVSASSQAVRRSSKANDTCQLFDQSEMLVGRMTVNEAEELAKKDNLKLMDMGVNSDGLRSFRLISGRELAEESKRQRMEKKTEKVKEKEFRVTSNITDHDFEIKLRQAKDVLSRGTQVKFVIKAHRRGGQADSNSLIAQLTKKVTKEVEGVAVVKQGIRTQGEQQLLLRPLPEEYQTH